VDDLRLASQLRAINDEPAAIDRAFLDALYEQLRAEVGFTPRQSAPTAASGVGRPAAGRAVRRRRARRWTPLLLVAALLIGGSFAVAAGVGGFIHRGAAPSERVPSVCDLVTTAEIGAIVGAPVTMESLPDSVSSGTGWTTRSCSYRYPPAPSTRTDRNLEISITRYADTAAARDQVQPGTAGIPLAGIGDAAVLFPSIAGSVPTQTLLVLRATYVVSVGYFANGGAINPTTPQMEDIARLILARL
jgi:hypothetical protein